MKVPHFPGPPKNVFVIRYRDRRCWYLTYPKSLLYEYHCWRRRVTLAATARQRWTVLLLAYLVGVGP